MEHNAEHKKRETITIKKLLMTDFFPSRPASENIQMHYTASEQVQPQPEMRVALRKSSLKCWCERAKRRKSTRCRNFPYFLTFCTHSMSCTSRSFFFIYIYIYMFRGTVSHSEGNFSVSLAVSHVHVKCD